MSERGTELQGLDKRQKSTDDYKHLTGPYLYFIEPFEKLLKDEVVRIAKKYRFLNILDMCCGLGTQCILLAKHRFKVAGVDLSPSMIAKAREIGPASISYHVGDAGNTPFKAGSFDAVVITMALHEKEHEKRHEIIKEIERLLKQGGYAVVIDYGCLAGREQNFNISLLPLWAVNGTIRTIEKLAGKEHYENYKDWLKRGGLRMLGNFNFSLVEKQEFYLGAIELIVAKRV